MAGHLQQSETGNAADLYPGAVSLEGISHAVFHISLITIGIHIDEIDYNQSPHITKSQLPGYLIGRFQIGTECSFFDVCAASGAGRVDINRYECLGGIDYHRSTGREFYFPLEGTLDLALDLVPVKQG